ncbi:hypothetical protein SLS55_005479 [Diplodia seriata]|uniref:Uncharacterized protein n=1 Tax=Diplodia seriata TaxID=420778 RepID=A0ABR3CGI1_9PEZI
MANPDGCRDHDRDVQIMKATLRNLLLPPKVDLAGIAQDLETDIDSARDEVNGILRRFTDGDERIQIGRADSSPSSSEENSHASAPVDTVKKEHHVDSLLMQTLGEKCDDAIDDALPAAATSHAHVSSPSVVPPPPADGNNSELPLAGSPDRSTAAPAPAPAPALPALVVPFEPPCDPCLESQHPEGEEIEDVDDESDWFYEDDDDHYHGNDGEKRTHVSDNSDDEKPPAKRTKKDDKQTTSGSPMTSSSKLHARLLLAADEAMVAKKEKEADAAAAAAAKEAAALDDTERTVNTALADRLNAADEPADKPAEEPSSGV